MSGKSGKTGAWEAAAMPVRLLILAEVGLYREALAASLGDDARFEVVAVATGAEETLELLEHVDPEIVLVDSRMTEGTATVRELAAASPRVKLIPLAVPE